LNQGFGNLHCISRSEVERLENIFAGHAGIIATTIHSLKFVVSIGADSAIMKLFGRNSSNSVFRLTKLEATLLFRERIVTKILPDKLPKTLL
jgi:hypothetical protein